MPSVKSVSSLARPYLTLMFATTFNVVCVWAWVRGDMPIADYVAAFGPIVATLLGFWFGERAALKDPKAVESNG